MSPPLGSISPHLSHQDPPILSLSSAPTLASPTMASPLVLVTRSSPLREKVCSPYLTSTFRSMIEKVLRPDGVQLNWLYVPTLARAYVTLSPSARIITRLIWLLSSPTNGTLTHTSTHPVTVVLSTTISRPALSTANFSPVYPSGDW